MAKAKKVTRAVKKDGKKKVSIKIKLFYVFMLFMAAVFLPTTALLFIALMPTFAAVFVDKHNRQAKVITVGAMNLAGATPFLLELWSRGHSFENAFIIVTDAKALIVIYSAAALGYVIDWAATGLVMRILYQRGKMRIKAIDKRQKDLIERWGKEVSGKYRLDQYGFAIKEDNDADQKEGDKEKVKD